MAVVIGGTVGAIVGTAVVGGAASYLAAGEQAGAAKAASNQSLQATRETNALTKEMYEQGREDLEPWMIAGENAIKKLETQPDFRFTSKDFKFMADPGFEFRLNEGINALDRSAASRGRILSGAQDKAITSYGQDMASQEYQNAYNRWQSEEANRFNREQSVYNTNENHDRYLAGQGQAAAAGQAAAGNDMANTTANTTMAGITASNNALISAGDANASGITGIAKSINRGVENYLLPNNYMSKF